MFKVECPGCKAPYQVDERRVPQSGLKMRCPKCGTSFKVDSPGSASEAPPPVLGAALGLGAAPPVPERSRAAAAGLKSTMLGVAAPAGLLDEPNKPKRPPPPPRLSRAGQNAPEPAPAAPPPPPQRPAASPAGAPRAKVPSLPEDDPYSEAELPMLGAAASPPARPPPPVRARPQAPAPGAPIAGPPIAPAFDRDLPATRQAAPGRAPDLDLPSVPARGRSLASPGGVGDADLPVRASDAASGALDLPSLPVQGAYADLPSVGSPRPAPAAPGEAFDFDLPEAAGVHGDRMSDPFLDLDLPTPSADLPSPGGPAGGVPLLSLDSVLPVSGDLPSPAVALPAPAAVLPQVASGRQILPSVASALPVPAGSLPIHVDALPSATEAAWSARPLPGADFEKLASPTDAGLDLESGFGDDGTFGELELPLGSDPFASSAAGSQLTEARAPAFDAIASDVAPAVVQRHSRPPEPLERQAGGGTAFGEVNLIGDDEPAAEVVLEDVRPRQHSFSEEDMEFGAIPQEEPQVASAAASAAAQVRMNVGVLAPERRQRSRGVKVALGVLVVVSVGGGALALVPDVGPFGYYAIGDVLKSGEYQALTLAVVKDTRQLLSKDTFPAAVRAVERAESARLSALRQRPLAAYAAFIGFARQMRFGADSKIHARAEVTLAALKEHGDVQYFALADAAREAVDGKPETARRALRGVLSRDKSNIDAWVILGELELRVGDGEASSSAWREAVKLEKSARTSFGLARARLLADDTTLAETLAREALTKEPGHAGATLLVARVTWKREGDDKTILVLKEVIENKRASLSPQELVIAQTILGQAYLARTRIGLAEAAFGEALKVDPKSAAALEGLGQALYAGARFSEALARYEAAAQADPKQLDAKLGILKCKLVLDRVKEAGGLAATLRGAYPKSSSAALWHGHALEALGIRDEAETAYRAAVELSEKDASAVEAYVALAMLLNQQGNTEEAQKLLDKARADLPSSPAIHKALGDVALTQGRYDDALAEYDRALAIDASDLRAQFQRGVTLRRAQQLDKAGEALDRVAQVDRDYPGLALERGLLHEAAGRSEEALKAYEAALSKAPDDADLMLRVGCSNVTAGRAKEAEKLLRKVLLQRPNSAETNHCLGRALLLDPSRLADAQRALERAVSIDPNRPEYHLYVGWAANEARNFSKAEKALERALELDKSLGDAYWQRGVLLARQGAVKDAIKDLEKALVLRPTRYEAYAALADAYYDLGREPEALGAWQRAVSAIPSEAAWRFRYGKLLLANRQTAAAEAELTAALKLVAAVEPKPRWEGEAHLLLGQLLGSQAAAVPHWEAFLERAPLDSPYIMEAKRALARLGHPWKGK